MDRVRSSQECAIFTALSVTSATWCWRILSWDEVMKLNERGAVDGVNEGQEAMRVQLSLDKRASCGRHVGGVAVGSDR